MWPSINQYGDGLRIPCSDTECPRPLASLNNFDQKAKPIYRLARLLYLLALRTPSELVKRNKISKRRLATKERVNIGMAIQRKYRKNRCSH